VHAGDEALDDLAGAEVEPADAGDGRGVQEPAGIFLRFDGHGYNFLTMPGW
jgi:hypothetical protein